jgi:hypothetical protein
MVKSSFNWTLEQSKDDLQDRRIMACIRRSGGRNNLLVRDVLFARAALQRAERDDIFDRRQEARVSDMSIEYVEQQPATHGRFRQSLSRLKYKCKHTLATIRHQQTRFSEFHRIKCK